MEIFVHYPNTEQGTHKLAMLIAKIHAEAAISYIEKLPCPKEQKETLLKSIMQK